MKKKNKKIIPKGFFSQPRPTISSKEALKEIVPMNWDKVTKERKDNKDQIVILPKFNK